MTMSFAYKGLKQDLEHAAQTQSDYYNNCM